MEIKPVLLRMICGNNNSERILKMNIRAKAGLWGTLVLGTCLLTTTANQAFGQLNTRAPAQAFTQEQVEKVNGLLRQLKESYSNEDKMGSQHNARLEMLTEVERVAIKTTEELTQNMDRLPPETITQTVETLASLIKKDKEIFGDTSAGVRRYMVGLIAVLGVDNDYIARRALSVLADIQDHHVVRYEAVQGMGWIAKSSKTQQCFALELLRTIADDREADDILAMAGEIAERAKTATKGFDKRAAACANAPLALPVP
jgi:hypothetical protein